MSSNAIKKLRLKRGDILVVRDHETLTRVISMGATSGIDFAVPIIVAPDGIKRVNREYLKKLLDKSEK